MLFLPWRYRVLFVIAKTHLLWRVPLDCISVSLQPVLRESHDTFLFLPLLLLLLEAENAAPKERVPNPFSPAQNFLV